MQLKNKKSLALALSTIMMTQTLVISKAYSASGADQKAPSELRNESRPSLALNESQRLALKYLLSALLVRNKAEDLVKINDEIAAKYQKMKISSLGGVPVSSVGLSTAYTGFEVLKKVDFIVKPLTVIARASADGIVYTSKQSAQVLDFLKFGVALEYSVKSSSRVYDAVVAPLLKLIIKNNLHTSSGFISAGGSFVGSVNFVLNDSQTIMTKGPIRNLLGMDREVSKRVGQVVANIAQIFELNPSQQEVLRLAIIDDVLKQAIAKSFSQREADYSIDLISIMTAKNILTQNEIQAIQQIREASQKIDLSGETMSQESLVEENVNIALEMAALIETQLKAGTINDKEMVRQLYTMLGSLDHQLRTIGFTMKR